MKYIFKIGGFAHGIHGADRQAHLFLNEVEVKRGEVLSGKFLALELSDNDRVNFRLYWKSSRDVDLTFIPSINDETNRVTFQSYKKIGDFHNTPETLRDQK